MELKPCPLCVGDAEMHFDRLGGKTIYMVKCSVDKCQCQEMGWHETEDEAIAIWNSRPIEDALRTRIVELEEYLIHMKDVYLTDNHEFGLTMKFADENVLLKKRIAKLEKHVVVWHKYPDEKPERPMCKTLPRPVDWLIMLIAERTHNNSMVYVKHATYYWDYLS